MEIFDRIKRLGEASGIEPNKINPNNLWVFIYAILNTKYGDSILKKKEMELKEIQKLLNIQNQLDNDINWIKIWLELQYLQPGETIIIRCVDNDLYLEDKIQLGNGNTITLVSNSSKINYNSGPIFSEKQYLYSLKSYFTADSPLLKTLSKYYRSDNTEAPNFSFIFGE